MPYFTTFDLKEENRIDLVRKKGAELIIMMEGLYKKGIDVEKTKKLLHRYEENTPTITDRLFSSAVDLEKF